MLDSETYTLNAKRVALNNQLITSDPSIVILSPQSQTLNP
jgi:hypothetical protein